MVSASFPYVAGMGASCCGNEARFDGLDPDYKRRLWLVIGINAVMFFVEMGAGALAGSRALQADALDFFGDTLTYGMTLAVIGTALRVRAWAAFVKGASLTLMGVWVLRATTYHVLIVGAPRAEVMGVVGLLALAANLASVLILMRYREGDANVRSVWLCSRNDWQRGGDARGAGCLAHRDTLARPNRCGIDGGRLRHLFGADSPAGSRGAAQCRGDDLISYCVA